MKCKVQDLTGPALDWAVAKCEGYFAKSPAHKYDGTWIKGADFLKMHRADEHGVHWTHSSTDWAEGGPLIEREKITLDVFDPTGDWRASVYKMKNDEIVGGEGTTPLIAAMRCYVSSKLGEEIEIPEELV